MPLIVSCFSFASVTVLPVLGDERPWLHPLCFLLWCCTALVACLSCALVAHFSSRTNDHVRVWRVCDALGIVLLGDVCCWVMCAVMLQLIFWILTGSCITVYCAVLPFNNIASGFIVEKWLLPYNTTTHSYTPESELVRALVHMCTCGANEWAP